MTATTCQNCGKPVADNFCSHCGQKTSTHRITTWHFLSHDLLHGVWHFDKGIFFTLKEAFTRPGLAAMDYIAGKRIRYYNVFYLLLLVIGAHLFADHYLPGSLDGPELKDGKVLAFATKNVKLVLVALVPLFSLLTLLIFRRWKYNYAEHTIIAGMVVLGVNVIALLATLISAPIPFNSAANDVMAVVTILAMFTYIIWCYRQISRAKNYTKGAFFWRILLFFFILLLLLFAAAFVELVTSRR